MSVNLPGVRMIGNREAVITARVTKDLAEALREEARRNYQTVSGMIAQLLAERFSEKERLTE